MSVGASHADLHFEGERRGPPIDPLTGPPSALAGRVVTMDPDHRVLSSGVVYVRAGQIVAVQPRDQPAPPGFEDVPVVPTRGTLYPGLIELHNHLSYDALPLWDVPKAFVNREGWGGTSEYRKRISGPMTVIGRSPKLIPSLIRYVECKCLMGGVTTTQGVMLASNAGVRRFYRGLVRNVEQTDDPALPEATARIDDVDATDADRFLSRLKKQSCLLLHLAEGIDDRARKHFLALRVREDEWAITRQLAGIHCAGLKVPDFDVFARHGGATIWSPLSNLLLYGRTADIKTAKASGVRLGIGSDWSPSGSKNLLGELKVAKLHSEAEGGVFTDRELVAMATSWAAEILQWTGALGSLQRGARADILVIRSSHTDPYAALIGATESDIALVLINGVARYGMPSLMHRLSPHNQSVRVGGRYRRLCLDQDTQDPSVGNVSLSDAREALCEALRDIRKLAVDLERPKPAPRRASAGALDEPGAATWTLALDELHDTGVELRPRLPFGPGGERTGPSLGFDRAPTLLSEIVEPVAIDPLTVSDDSDYIDRLALQRNLSEDMKRGLKKLY